MTHVRFSLGNISAGLYCFLFVENVLNVRKCLQINFILRLIHFKQPYIHATFDEKYICTLKRR